MGIVRHTIVGESSRASPDQAVIEVHIEDGLLVNNDSLLIGSKQRVFVSSINLNRQDRELPSCLSR